MRCNERGLGFDCLGDFREHKIQLENQLEHSTSQPKAIQRIDRNRWQSAITDFGLAKRLDHGTDLTVTGAVLGTPAYVPPEQVAGRRGEIEPAGDIYSRGAVLYEPLTGRPPYRGETAWDTVMRDSYGGADSASITQPGYSHRLGHNLSDMHREATLAAAYIGCSACQ